VVSIGLIVDDTIHVFYRKTVLSHVKQQELSLGIVVTTIILFVSFISFTLSDFTPTQTFGLIASIVFVVALISDLAMLPYLLTLLKRKDEKK
jgi:predicted RND superfamily exporter protein